VHYRGFAGLAPLLESRLPGGRGLEAWQALLREEATLLRQLEKGLESETGLLLLAAQVGHDGAGDTCALSDALASVDGCCVA
jgi:hypothetical protein